MGETSDILALARDDIELALVPGVGGAVSHFRWRGIHILRPLAEQGASVASALGAAMFPMVPFANRVTGNAFAVDGRRYEVQPNVDGQRYHVHGTGWQRPWHVTCQDRESATLTLKKSAGEDPFSYRAVESFRLHPDGFEVWMELTNTGDERMPMGMGQHPWFNRSPGATIEFTAGHYYREGPDLTSGARMPVPANLDFSKQRSLPERWINNDFGGWLGSATIRFPTERATVAIRADSVFGHLMVYSDPTMPFFCLEPQSHAAGALNRAPREDPDGGLAILEPDESLAGSIRFHVREGLDRATGRTSTRSG